MLTLYPGFYPCTFVYSCFPPKIQFLYYLLSSLYPWGDPVVSIKRKIFEIRVSDRWKMHFQNSVWLFFTPSLCLFLIFLGILELYGEFRRKVDWRDTTFLYLFLQNVNQRRSDKNKSIKWRKKRKQNMERLSFITTQFKFLPPFTGCIKVLGKMLACLILFTILRSKRNKNRFFPW